MSRRDDVPGILISLLERCRGIAENNRHRFTRYCMNELHARSGHRISSSVSFLRLRFISRIRVRAVPLDLTSRVANYMEVVWSFRIMARKVLTASALLILNRLS